MNAEKLKKLFPHASLDFLEKNLIIPIQPKQLEGVFRDDGEYRKSEKSFMPELHELLQQPIVGEVKTCTVSIAPMGAVRTTRNSLWDERCQKYAAWKKDFQFKVSEAFNGLLPDVPVRADFEFHIAIPDSWSKKKKKEMNGKPHRQRPDFDNILKSCFDSLFTEDGGIAEGYTKKRWCLSGQERITMVFYY